MSEDMSPYCSAHDEWLIMKLCMYVGGYHDANNVSNFGGDPVTQLNLKTFYSIIYAILQTWCSIAVIRSQFLRRLLRDHAQIAAVPKTVAVKEIRGHTSLSTSLVYLIIYYSGTCHEQTPFGPGKCANMTGGRSSEGASGRAPNTLHNYVKLHHHQGYSY